MRHNAMKIGGSSGLILVICFLVGYSIAWSLSPWYSFGGNYLSDLGIRDGALAFNLGLMSTALIGMPFAWGIWQTLREHILGRLGSIVLVLAGVFLFLIGLFPEDVKPIHHIVSVSFFLFFGIALVILARPMIHSTVFRRIAAPLTIIIIFSFFLVIPLGTGPLMETIAVLEAIIWVLVVSIQMILFARSKEKENSLQE
ncbi:MAG: DUF998 domain-containing protein [Thermoplasmata archaeon]